jgi:hypothetical protein
MRIYIQSLEKMLIRAKNILQKFNMVIKKEENPLKKFFKNVKSYLQNATEICTLFTFTHVHQLVLLITFLDAFLKTCSMEINYWIVDCSCVRGAEQFVRIEQLNSCFMFTFFSACYLLHDKSIWFPSKY